MTLDILMFCLPGCIKKKKLNELFKLTAGAFESSRSLTGRHSFAEALSEYALFTQEQSVAYLQSGRPLPELRSRLYQNSYAFGRKLRNDLHIISDKRSIDMLKSIYRMIGIDLRYDGKGGFMISRCFFSKYYTKEVCALISSLDEGMAAGLTGRGLYFEQRMTEGCGCCKGYFGSEAR
jgi:hypothetical protein